MSSSFLKKVNERKHSMDTDEHQGGDCHKHASLRLAVRGEPLKCLEKKLQPATIQGTGPRERQIAFLNTV